MVVMHLLLLNLLDNVATRLQFGRLLSPAVDSLRLITTVLS